MPFTSLRKKFLTGIMFFSLMMSSAGCVPVVVGSLGAVGGYMVSPDTVEGVISSKEYEDVWKAAVETISLTGIIEEQSNAGGLIIAQVRGARVTIKIIRMTALAVKLSVRARKMLLPRIKLSQDIYVKIVNYLDENG